MRSSFQQFWVGQTEDGNLVTVYRKMAEHYPSREPYWRLRALMHAIHNDCVVITASMDVELALDGEACEKQITHWQKLYKWEPITLKEALQYSERKGDSVLVQDNLF